MDLFLGITCIALVLAVVVLSVLLWKRRGEDKYKLEALVDLAKKANNIETLERINHNVVAAPEDNYQKLVTIERKVLEINKSVADYQRFSETVAELVLIIPVALRASLQIKEFEHFFEDSLEDVSSVLEMLDKLMKRQVVSDDPDVQNFYRVMGITHDVLLGYINAGRERKEKEE